MRSNGIIQVNQILVILTGIMNALPSRKASDPT